MLKLEEVPFPPKTLILEVGAEPTAVRFDPDTRAIVLENRDVADARFAFTSSNDPEEDDTEDTTGQRHGHTLKINGGPRQFATSQRRGWVVVWADVPRGTIVALTFL